MNFATFIKDHLHRKTYDKRTVHRRCLKIHINNSVREKCLSQHEYKY